MNWYTKIFLIAAVAGAVCAVLLWYVRGHQNNLINAPLTSLPNTAATSSEVTSAGDQSVATSTPVTQVVDSTTRLYKNTQYHFSLTYPNNLAATEYAEANGALTATFNDDSSGQSFEIYVTPFTGKQITADRFKLDEPSGVYAQPTDVVIGGTRATMFFGQNTVMGDTREVWFIRGGYLYEVTTYKDLDAWLGHILQGWVFI